AFVIVQVMDAVAEPLHLSDAFQQGVLGLRVAGLPITLVLAWYNGEQGRQRVGGPELLMIALLLVLTGSAVTLFGSRREVGNEGQNAAVGASAPSGDEARPLLAVLPLDNNSPAADDAYFADGVHEELISRLAHISALRVTSRFSVDRYRDRASRPALGAIAAELGADFLIEGSARIGGGLVRVTVQLVDGRTDEHVWSENFDSPYSPEEYIRTQAEIAQRIASRVHAEIPPEEERRIGAVPTSSLEAFDHYIRGNVLFGEPVATSAERALREYRLAVAADPEFAEAYAGIGLCCARKVDFEWTGDETDDALLRAGLEAAERAIRLAPTHADGWVAKGYNRFLLDPYDPPAIVAAFERAVTLDPRHHLAQSLWPRRASSWGTTPRRSPTPWRPSESIRPLGTSPTTAGDGSPVSTESPSERQRSSTPPSPWSPTMQTGTSTVGSRGPRPATWTERRPRPISSDRALPGKRGASWRWSTRWRAGLPRPGPRFGSSGIRTGKSTGLVCSPSWERKSGPWTISSRGGCIPGT
ncbi:MAG: hypothetical protein PVI57_17010, partial [Gemmatimonadota bacterium]